MNVKSGRRSANKWTLSAKKSRRAALLLNGVGRLQSRQRQGVGTGAVAWSLQVTAEWLPMPEREWRSSSGSDWVLDPTHSTRIKPKNLCQPFLCPPFDGKSCCCKRVTNRTRRCFIP